MRVEAYRLICYENRVLEDEDFNDDTKDAGEIGAGHRVTALYELVPKGADVEVPAVDPLKYQRPVALSAAAANELLTVKLRYKEPEGDVSKLSSFALEDGRGAAPSADFRFASAVAAFGMLLRESPYRGNADWDQVETLARAGLGTDAHGYRREFIELVELASELSKSQPSAEPPRRVSSRGHPGSTGRHEARCAGLPAGSGFAYTVRFFMTSMPSPKRISIAAVTLTLSAHAWAGPKTTPLQRAGHTIAESSLLDVHIAVFEPADDFLAEARDAEARYVPVALKQTLEASGYWGTVRVVPGAAHADVTISGAVSRSDGSRLELEMAAFDATGRLWLDEKYKGKADASEYLDPASTVDPYLDVYHRIANDLSKRYRKLRSEEIQTIRDVSQLRFAGELAPDAFGDYVVAKKKRYVVVRLPARDDPMLQRVERIRQRDAVFVDTVDAYYRRLYERMIDAYHGWRSQDYWQREAMKNGPPTAQRSGGRNAPLGVLKVGGGRGWPGDTRRVCGTAGGDAGPCEDERELEDEWRDTHLDVLVELGESLAADVAPLVVDVEGQVAELTGSVETQYAQWRALMKELFAAETGLSISRR